MGIGFSPETIFETKDEGTPIANASAFDLPRSFFSHSFKSIGSIVFPHGETLSRPIGEFYFSPMESEICDMVTVEETVKK